MKLKRIKEKDKNCVMEFEINFYEKLLEEQPNFKECMKVLAELYTKIGMYKNGLELDKKLSQLLPSDATVFYNLACSYSLIGDVDNSFNSIKKAVELGFNDFDYMRQDADLMNLKKDKRFDNFLPQNRR